MNIKKVAVTGDAMFIRRHQYLFTALSPYFEELQCIPRNGSDESKVSYLWRRFRELIYCVTNGISLSNSPGLYKNPQAFIARSNEIKLKINQMRYNPDFVFHLFGTYCPFWEPSEIPYAMYLDYTMALCHKYYKPWAPFPSHEDLCAWIKYEQKAYEQAKYIFTMSNLVKSSLIEDYGICPDKITVVGASGNFLEPYTGEKHLGSQKILFNGSEFERKGGDLVLAAFAKVKKILPTAKLVVIGKKINALKGIDGVENPGVIFSSSDLENIFLDSDIVVAPANCEPFGVFLVEAMNYGVPCIVTANNANGINEFLEHEVDSIIFHQSTPDVLAHHIINVLKDSSLLMSMSKAARDKVRTNLNWNHIASKISQVLLRCV